MPLSSRRPQSRGGSVKVTAELLRAGPAQAG